jgi:hypothetical protein
MDNSNLKIVLMILISIFEIWVLKNAKKVYKSNKNDKKMKFKIFDFLAISTTENTNFDIKVLTWLSFYDIWAYKREKYSKNSLKLTKNGHKVISILWIFG